MRRSEGSAVSTVLIDTFRRTIWGYLLAVVVLAVFPFLPGLNAYAGNWYIILLGALLLHGMYFVSTLNDAPRLRKLINHDRPVAPVDDIRLDGARRPYLDDVRNKREIMAQRIGQMTQMPSLTSDMGAMLAELDRLVPDLEGLLKRNQRLELDIKRFESGSSTSRPSAESMKELRELYQRQWEVIKRVTGEVATFDANLAIMVNQFDAQRDAEEIDAQVKEWSGNLTAWKDSIRQVYG